MLRKRLEKNAITMGDDNDDDVVGGAKTKTISSSLSSMSFFLVLISFFCLGRRLEHLKRNRTQ